MRILFLTHYYPPEVNAPANRTHEHCREWVWSGHEVHVITGIPSHPRGEPFPGYHRAWYQRETTDGVHVHRVWTYLAPNTGVARRLANYLSFVPSATWRSLRLGTFDVVIATSPQFFCAVAGRIVGALKRTPWIFELRDLWPDSVAAVGAVRARILLRLAERLELHLYRSAHRVVCVTRSFIANLTARGIDPAKLTFVPNGIDPDVWAAGDRTRGRNRLGLRDDDFVATYIGTVGMAHGIGTVLDAASASPARFVIVGDGAELDSLRHVAEQKNLQNVTFTGLVPRDQVPDIMAASDVALVLLRNTPLFETVLPSKMFEAMAAGRPIVLGVKGEAKTLLERAGAGIPMEPEDPQSLRAALDKLATDAALHSEMASRGPAFVASEFSRRHWAGQMLASIAPARREPLSPRNQEVAC